jgi:hypothetical protein
LLVIGDKNVFGKVTKIKIDIGDQKIGAQKKLTSRQDFPILQEFLMKPCLSHPCG